MARKRTIIKDVSKLCDRCDEAILQDEKTLNQTINAIKLVLKSEDMVALSAPQLGFNSRIFCIKFADGQIKTFINPLITKTEGVHLSREKCESIPDKEYLVLRHNDIVASYQLEDGKLDQNLFQGVVSEVFQQMCHLLDGVLISDFGLEILPEFDSASQEEKDELIKSYLDSLEEQTTNLQNDIKDNPNLKQAQDAINFMAGVEAGQIQLEPRKLNREQRRSLKKLKRRK